ncbi:MAG: hypothetical protein SVY53_08560 [Chloroflexota bacterium]|nr:hypothetical protein [Chloroflexota bacterium]
MKVIPYDATLTLKLKTKHGIQTLQKRVPDINISEDEWSIYGPYCQPIVQEWEFLQRDVLRIRMIPDGIGDLHWLFMKLSDLKSRCNASKIILYTTSLNDKQDYYNKNNRIGEFIAMCPLIDETYKVRDEVRTPACGYMIDVLGYDYIFDPLKIMMSSGNYREWIHDVKTEYMYSFKEPDTTLAKLRSCPVLYFGDRHAEVSWSGDWTDDDWATVTKRLFEMFKTAPVSLGMGHDVVKDKSVVCHGGIQISLVGSTTLAEALAQIRRAPLVVGGPSGLTIYSASRGIPTIILWPDDSSLHPLPIDHRYSWSSYGLPYVATTYSTTPDKLMQLVAKLLEE